MAASSARACSPPERRLQRAVGVEVVDAEPAADLLGARLGGPGAGGLGALERVRVGVEVAGPLERGERLAGLAERVVQQVVDRDVAGASCGR